MTVHFLLTLALVHLGVLFIGAGTSKALSGDSFQGELLQHGVLPEPLSRIVGLSLPPTEFLLGVLLFSGIVPRISCSVAAVLLGSFVCYRGAVAVSSQRAHQAKPCGCFGAASVADGKRSFAVGTIAALVNLLVALAVAITAPRTFGYSGTVSLLLLAVLAVSVTFLYALRRARIRTPATEVA